VNKNQESSKALVEALRGMSTEPMSFLDCKRDAKEAEEPESIYIPFFNC
jgi:hypothetical protein